MTDTVVGYSTGTRTGAGTAAGAETGAAAGTGAEGRNRTRYRNDRGPVDVNAIRRDTIYDGLLNARLLQGHVATIDLVHMRAWTKGAQSQREVGSVYWAGRQRWRG